MSLKPIVIIEPTTLASTGPEFIEITGADIPATLIATGLTGGEAMLLAISMDNGVTAIQISIDGVSASLLADNNVITINSPMTLVVVKFSTSNPAGAFLATQGLA